MNEKIYVKIIVSCIFAAVLVLFGLIKCLPESWYMDGEYPYWMEQKDHVMEDGQKQEILLLGDSRMKMDLLAYELSDDAYNIALGGGSPIEMYYAMKNYLEHHPVPKAVFIAFGPIHYQEPECYLTRNVYFHYLDNDTIDEANRVIKENGGKDFSADSTPYQYRLPSAYLKPVVKSLIKPRTQENLAVYQKTREHRGQMFGRDKSMETVYTPETKFDSFVCADYLDYYMKSLIELCLENKIPIYIEQMPMGNPGYQKLADKGYLDAYEQYMEALEDEYHIPVNKKIPVYPAGDFQDNSHLNEEGARKFTRQFKEKYENVFR